MTKTEAVATLCMYLGCRRENDSVCSNTECEECVHFIPSDEITEAISIVIPAVVQILKIENDIKKKARWVGGYKNIYMDFTCSECGKPALYLMLDDIDNDPTYIEERSNYCPHCGARMEGYTDEN